MSWCPSHGSRSTTAGRGIPDGDELFRSLDPHGWEINLANPSGSSPTSHRYMAARAVADSRHPVERIARLARVLEEDRARPEAPIEGIDGPVVFVCAEFGIHRSLPIYSGGLGVARGGHPQAGERPRAADGRRRPALPQGLLPAAGRPAGPSTSTGRRRPGAPADRRRCSTTAATPLRLTFPLSAATVAFHVWRAEIGRVPLYLLDAELDENDPIDRWITARLYEGNPHTGSASTACSASARCECSARSGSSPASCISTKATPRSRRSSSPPRPSRPASRSTTRSPPRESGASSRPTRPCRPATSRTSPARSLEAFADVPARLGIDDERFLDLCRGAPRRPTSGRG